MLRRHNPAPMNTLSIHVYAGEEAEEACGVWATDYAQFLSAVCREAQADGLPIFVGEFGLADGQEYTPTQVRARFTNTLRFMQDSGVSMAALWAFDQPEQAHTWNINFDNHRFYMLELAIEANDTWLASISEN